MCAQPSRTLGSFCDSCVRCDLLCISPPPLVRSFCTYERYWADPTLLIIETSEGSGALGLRNFLTQGQWCPPTLGLDPPEDVVKTKSEGSGLTGRRIG